MLLVALVATWILFVFGSIFATHPWIFLPGLQTPEVSVEFADGQITVEPAQIGPARSVVFNVANVDDGAHMILLLRTDVSADRLPVENGQVPLGPSSGQPAFMHWLDPGGHDVITRAGGKYPDTATGPLIQPGDSMVMEIAWGGIERIPSGTTIILFCNLPGHYERGEYTTLAVE